MSKNKDDDDQHHRKTSNTSNSSQHNSANGRPAAPIAMPDEGATNTANTPAPSSDPVVVQVNNRKRSPEEYTRNFELNEISPLNSTANGNDRISVTEHNGDAGLLLAAQMNGSDAPVIVAMSTDETFAAGTKNERKRFKGNLFQTMYIVIIYIVAN